MKNHLLRFLFLGFLLSSAQNMPLKAGHFDWLANKDFSNLDLGIALLTIGGGVWLSQKFREISDENVRLGKKLKKAKSEKQNLLWENENLIKDKEELAKRYHKAELSQVKFKQRNKNLANLNTMSESKITQLYLEKISLLEKNEKALKKNAEFESLFKLKCKKIKELQKKNKELMSNQEWVINIMKDKNHEINFIKSLLAEFANALPKELQVYPQKLESGWNVKFKEKKQEKKSKFVCTLISQNEFSNIPSKIEIGITKSEQKQLLLTNSPHN